MYVYKIKPLHFTKAREVVSYFTTVNALALVMHSLRDKAEIQRIKYVLHEGLAVAQKFGCTENDAIKRKKYSDVHITFLYPFMRLAEECLEAYCKDWRPD